MMASRVAPLLQVFAIACEIDSLVAKVSFLELYNEKVEDLLQEPIARPCRAHPPPGDRRVGRSSLRFHCFATLAQALFGTKGLRPGFSREYVARSDTISFHSQPEPRGGFATVLSAFWRNEYHFAAVPTCYRCEICRSVVEGGGGS